VMVVVATSLHRGSRALHRLVDKREYRSRVVPGEDNPLVRLPYAVLWNGRVHGVPLELPCIAVVGCVACVDP